MFLKRLELHGFKSFSHKTTIELLDGCTIVVGPNGCGKSNVLDAIKWVLGETSAKSLRGAKMGDVVFRGSSSMKPAHFAQVNLVLDNSAGSLKMDQSEVQVTRRLFSNGDSEYLINKQKARMRDIHELFLDTGLGADGYSIIEQGQIGTLVNSKPRDRRDLFEEAAGISRYKARREETLRKLVRTEEDLLRLFDIVSEVQRSCNSLYRQAKKAERHRRLTRRLNRLKRHLIVLRHRMHGEKLEQLTGRLNKARDEFEQANTKLATAEAERAEATQRIEEFQRQSQELQQERYDVQNAVNREQRRADSAKQAIAAIAERRTLIEREMSSSSNRLSILENTIQALETDLERERRELETQSVQLETKTRELDSMRSSSDATNQELARMRRELETERAKENKVLKDRSVAESLIERLTQELDNHEETVQRLRDEAAQASEDASKAGEALAQLKETITTLREEHETLRQRIAQSDRTRNELNNKLEELLSHYNKATSRLNALQEVEDSYEGFFRGVQVVMRASQEEKLQGIMGVLTNMLKVPKDYEVAIEVALGGSLQDIVTVSERDAQAAINFLKQTRNGRATFLPLDLLRDNGGYAHIVERILGRPGVVGLAKDLISYDNAIERAVDRRLGSTIVVEQLGAAVALQKQGLRNRYVSLDGQLVDPSGVMSGGSHQSRGFLSRTREIQEKREEVERLRREVEAARARLAEAKDQHSQDLSRAAELQARLHEDQMAEARAERDLEAADRRSRELRNQLASAEARHLQQRHDLTRHEETLAVCDAGLEELQGQIVTIEDAYQELEEGTVERTEKLSDLAEEVSAGRATVSGLRERVTNLGAKLEELRLDISQWGNDQEARESEQKELAEKRIASERELAGAEALLGQLIKQAEEVDARLSSLTQDNEAKLKEARESVAVVQGLQRDRNMKENAWREVEAETVGIKAQIDSLKQDALDEFGETIEEIAASLEKKEEEDSQTLVSPDGTEDGAEEAAAEEDELSPEDEALLSDPKELRREVAEIQDRISRMGSVNETAIDEYREQKERLDFLTAQRDDLIAAKDQLTETISNLDETTSRLFAEAYEAIRTNFQENFRRLFNGGNGDLLLVEEEGQPEPGIEIYAQPPGKKIGGSLTLMSGGEKAMTAIALMLSLFQFRPSPICILDEIDAPLDDVNCTRLVNALRDFAKTTQFLVITHNKITMQLSDTVYGVTMQEPGISKLVSVRFKDIDEANLLQSTG
ncbi:MAG: chromosome segregation protein SMC [Candidatus Sumerlaeia bacterium]|nr:chromosome segregation protein SMC [Candidatus Sumerlaeia bacterium]